ncbi:P-type DNA transfer ATPase VirB11 [Novosphingobium sp. B 225]|uniref:P-type DNA transfer ATPase VirB11 n=1 Tax=Novosphingobium sp. B 225 TaxID=1961849 RepID=UPI000B4BDD1D|nr:P-type DNA transfer ATPase VirB11 [Novosphingobium sp. B 225]
MNSTADNVYLGAFLAPLQAWLTEPDVTDLYINRPGELWVERLGQVPERIEVAELGQETLTRLVRQVAATSAQGISREHPLLSASLPGGERVQVILPPATRGEIAIAIRKHVIAGLSLEDYAETGAFADADLIAAGHAPASRPPLDPAEGPVAMLRRAVRERRNILVSGGTATGKTTFLNTLLREVGHEERLVLIEDTPELQIDHPNAVGLIAVRGAMGEADVTAEDLLTASLRMRPDRIVLGEVRGVEAISFLRAVNTGHPGSMSSIHADSPLRAVDQLALLVMQAGTRMGWDDVVTYVRRSLDIVVQLEHRHGRRRIAQVQVIG